MLVVTLMLLMMIITSEIINSASDNVEEDYGDYERDN